MAHDGLLTLSRRLHEARSLADVMDRVVASVTEHTRYQRAWLLLPITPTRGVEVFGYALPDRVRVDQRMAELDIARDRFLAHLFSMTDTLVIDDLRTWEHADQAQVEFFGNRTTIIVPMLQLGERIGAMVVGTFASEGVVPPTPTERAFIEQVAAMVSVVAARIRVESAQDALQERVRAAQRLEALGRMAGEVAHDFNSMLVSIMCNAELALEALGAHPATESVNEILLAADRAAALTKKLLAFSRGQPLARRNLDLGQVLATFMPILRSLLPDTVSVDLAVGTGLGTVHGDAGQIEQVVMNLVINARDALPTGGAIRIDLSRAQVDAAHVALHPASRSGDFVVVSVRDTGVGMPREVVDRVFEPFFTTKGVGRGTGLGLAVVESVVRMHDGFVELDSQEGAGTTFRVYLPARDLPADRPEPVRTSNSPDRARAAGGHVLVVDDDAQLRGVLERILIGAGYRVTTASDGQAALEEVQRLPDLGLVITDLMMPRLTGDVLVTRLAELRPRLPVLMLTGYARGAPLGAVEHLLSKPFSPRALLHKVAEVLRG